MCEIDLIKNNVLIVESWVIFRILIYYECNFDRIMSLYWFLNVFVG